MYFWDREKERKILREYLLDPNPDSIFFIYGPRKSGKTSLVLKVLRDLKKEYGNLLKFDTHIFKLSGRRALDGSDLIRMMRKEFVREEEEVDDEEDFFVIEIGNSSVSSVSDILYEIEKRETKTLIIFDGLNSRVTPMIDEDDFDGVFTHVEEDIFRDFFELLTVLTYESELAHVIVTTSSLFIVDHVLKSHVLRNSSRFMSVDYFPDDLTFSILVSEGLSKEEAEYFVKFVGGIPKMMKKVLSGVKVQDVIKEVYRYSRMWIFELLRNEGNFREILQRVLSGENLYHDEESFDLVKKLTDMGILYIDVLKSCVRFSSKIERNTTAKILGFKETKIGG